jgi:hypothetical protein
MSQIIDVSGTKYVVKRQFTMSTIKDEAILNELKWWWGGDTIIRNPTHDKILVAQKVGEPDWEETIDE